MVKVMVVDDNEVLREVLSEVLGRAGFEVITAADGSEALRLAQHLLPDFVLTDMDMPGMTGKNLCHALHEHPLLRSVPIAVLSGTLMPGEPCCLKVGACTVLLQPMSNRDLVSIVHRLVEETRAQRRLSEAPGNG